MWLRPDAKEDGHLLSIVQVLVAPDTYVLCHVSLAAIDSRPEGPYRSPRLDKNPPEQPHVARRDPGS